MIEQGVDLREQGKDVDALEKFKQAYAMSKSPRALAQIALAEQALGRWVDAEGNLQKAIAESSDKWIKSHKQPLEDALRTIQERLGSLDVLGTAGAELRVNGAPAGTLPLSQPLRVIAGQVTIDLSAPGYERGSLRRWQRPASLVLGRAGA